MYKPHLLFAFSGFLEKANAYLLPCPLKYLTGYDCPGCGFQRSFLALLKGNFQHSFHLYPPTVPILLTIVFSIAANYFWGSGNHKSRLLIKILFMVTGTFILVSYGCKMLMPHLHHA
ncbi:DUF2752 domain-containing protein [Pedobacter sp. AW31-3R]|uniref:DUF2752 domain-containing protein n=1 Tax=Pedobacter sp. AW31-3R TaxID=3445781 RepID=UPI003FA00D3B